MTERREHQQTTQPERKNKQQAVQTSGHEGQRQTGLARHVPFTPWTASPFSFMRRFTEEMDRLFENFGLGGGRLTPSFGRELWPRGVGEWGRAVWSPQIEAFEREGHLVVRADLPGLSKDDVKVQIMDDMLIIEGERRQEHEETRPGYYHSERGYGSFYRSIPLPEGVDTEKATATFNNGVLEITMPAPHHEPRGRQIPVQEAAPGQQKPKSVM